VEEEEEAWEDGFLADDYYSLFICIRWFPPLYFVALLIYEYADRLTLSSCCNLYLLAAAFDV
jgi:hypothetical protein